MIRINWASYMFRPYDSYGRYWLKLLRALWRAGADAHPLPMNNLDYPAEVQRYMGLDFTRLTISVMPPQYTKTLPGRQWIYTMHEATKIPDDWVCYINQNAERLIVPAPWLIAAMQESGVFDAANKAERAIHVVPGGVDPGEFPIVSDTNQERPFTFMCLADRGTRKGYPLVYTAFWKAFDETDDVRLIIKGRPGISSLDAFDNTLSADPMNRKISVWSQDMPSMSEVYPFADCFVFPTHCEGWGMPPREAACMGIPTIATNWSGLETGIANWCTMPLNEYHYVDAHMSTGGRWVWPDEDELIAAMRWMYENRTEAKRRALNNATWLRENMTWGHSAQKLIELVEKYG